MLFNAIIYEREEMLELKNVKKLYKTKSGEVAALNGVNLSFPSSGLVFVSGKSGCGKTTLLNVIGGLDGIDEGEISLFGKSFSSFTQSDYDDYRNTFIGFIFQEYNLLSEFSVEKNVEIAMELQGKKVEEAELKNLLKEMEIEDLKDRKPSELSGGQRQRVAIARALVKEPKIIMADEPTGALDSNTGIQVIEILKRLSKEKLVIVVSHDREFAEKYADRVIRLVDGEVVEDITFSESKMQKNVHEDEVGLLIREGADLTEEDKNVIAKAVKDCKKIELIKELSFRESHSTDVEKIEKVEKQVKLTTSKMKLKSSIALGVKSLWVKPLRLIFTILLSAVAFAVFGLFDTLASFNTASVMRNLVASNDSISVYGEYVVDEPTEDVYQVKLSSEETESLKKTFGGSIKGVYDFKDNTGGYVANSYSISDLNSTEVTWGSNYYTKQFTGFVEFSDDEINADGSFKNFNYKIIIGRYPKLEFDEFTGEPMSGMNEIAISTYIADSMVHYLYGKQLREKYITTRANLIGEEIAIDNTFYKVVGIIDCGEIPDKYEPLKEKVVSVASVKTLIEDFKSYINSSANRCVFVAEGRREEIVKRNKNENVYFSGNNNWSAITYDKLSSRPFTKRADSIMYSVDDCDVSNVIYFNGKIPTGKKVQLADDEVLVYPTNIEEVFAAEYTDLIVKDRTKMHEVNALLSQLENHSVSLERKREIVSEVMKLLGVDKSQLEKSMTLKKTSTKSHKLMEKQVKVVGIYVDFDVSRPYPGSYYRFMMNDNLMQEFDVYNGQGEYSRLLVSSKTSNVNTAKLVEYMLVEKGLSLVWYGNSALDVVRLNEEIIKQGADLFLYAALVLALFSVFMLFNYISTSIVNKRQTIGVLRGLGSGGRDILRMFLTESLIIAIINGILAVVFAALGCVFVNSYIFNVMNISIPFAFFGIRQVLIILLMSLVTAGISSALPIFKIAREKPVDLIRRP